MKSDSILSPCYLCEVAETVCYGWRCMHSEAKAKDMSFEAKAKVKASGPLEAKPQYLGLPSRWLGESWKWKEWLCVSYKKLEALAQKILAKNPNATEVLDKLRQLKAEQDEMEDLWEKRNKELTDAKDLQVGVSLVK